jgi:hypothetical protein
LSTTRNYGLVEKHSCKLYGGQIVGARLEQRVYSTQWLPDDVGRYSDRAHDVVDVSVERPLHADLNAVSELKR